MDCEGGEKRRRWSTHTIRTLAHAIRTWAHTILTLAHIHMDDGRWSGLGLLFLVKEQKYGVGELGNFCQCHDCDAQPETERSSDVREHRFSCHLRLIRHRVRRRVLLYEVHFQEVLLDQIHVQQFIQYHTPWKRFVSFSYINVDILVEAVLVNLSFVLAVLSVEGKLVRQVRPWRHSVWIFINVLHTG